MGPARCQYETLGKYRCLLAPLRYGAGIKGKIADAWSVATPVVTSPLGSEGMMPEDWSVKGVEFGGHVASDLDEFADLAVMLMEDDAAWESAALNAHRCAVRLFEFQEGASKLLSAISEAGLNMETRRENNWLQALLMDEYHRSTEFKSRYIEAAQRNRNS